MPFYAHPTSDISPGDIYPDVPIAVIVPPLRVLRPSKLNVPRKFGPQVLRRVFSLPEDAGKLENSNIQGKGGEETVAVSRAGLAMLLSWGSQIEADERDMEKRGGKAQNRGWLAAPIHRMEEIPEQGVIQDPSTGEQVMMREVIRKNETANYFYLPPFPDRSGEGEHFLDFGRMSLIGIRFFTDSKAARVATLTEESLKLLYSQLMWFFTRAEIFVRQLSCPKCGAPVPSDVRFEGQNFDAEPWL